MSNPRAAKVAERIQQIIARRLEKGLRDPRMGFVTITDVRVTGDLQQASVFYTVYGSEEEQRDTAAALKAATGMFRTEVGKNITARLTPSLEFVADGIPETAALIAALLASACVGGGGGSDADDRADRVRGTGADRMVVADRRACAAAETDWRQWHLFGAADRPRWL